jgi:GNAT superfamily N-acetyltransferase
LRALSDAPLAFGSTLAEEQAFPEDVWVARAVQGAAGEDRVTYVAEQADHWLGIATGLTEGLDKVLVGMFVEPAARGRGIGMALVEAVTGWARGRGGARLYLYVTATNDPAIRLYRKCSFRPTGKIKQLEQRPSVDELEMVRDLILP